MELGGNPTCSGNYTTKLDERIEVGVGVGVKLIGRTLHSCFQRMAMGSKLMGYKGLPMFLPWGHVVVINHLNDSLQWTLFITPTKGVVIKPCHM